MATGGKQRDTRAERERARVYQARQSFHDSLARRRRRDDLIAGIAGGALIVAILIGQTLYFTAGPGAPSPAPTATPSTSPSSTPVPSDTASPEPSPTVTE
ncbi:dioxygenase [Microbacterium sp. NPDC064584]|uniref:dioxygenase n=1 Tax=Microbacterium sp. NPDC064584 TaxID=3155817 RepID=UPI00343275E1